MVSAREKKFIKSLQIKKYRQQHQAFLVEGWKSVSEVLQSGWEVLYLFVSDKYAHECDGRVIKESDLKAISSMANNKEALAVVRMPALQPSKTTSDKLIFYFDGLQDPGNLGTVIRTADWLGISGIYCSDNSVDFYNPKTISATKGSFLRVQPVYMEPNAFFEQHNDRRVLLADMGGTDFRANDWTKPSVIVMGNESLGVRDEIRTQFTDRITIPKRGGAESLNVAMAFGILAAHS